VYVQRPGDATVNVPKDPARPVVQVARGAGVGNEQAGGLVTSSRPGCIMDVLRESSNLFKRNGEADVTGQGKKMPAQHVTCQAGGEGV
jgi:hypothetical protein